MIITVFIWKFRKFISLSKPTKLYFYAGGVVYLFGAFILEATINLLNHDKLEWVWKIESLAEESFEMLGAFLVIIAVMKHADFQKKRQL